MRMNRRRFLGLFAAAPLAAVVPAVQAKSNTVTSPGLTVADIKRARDSLEVHAGRRAMEKLALDLIGAKTEYRWRHDMVDAPWMAVTTVNISGEPYSYATLHTSLGHAEANHQRAALAAIRKFVHAPGL